VCQPGLDPQFLEKISEKRGFHAQAREPDAAGRLEVDSVKGGGQTLGVVSRAERSEGFGCKGLVSGW